VQCVGKILFKEADLLSLTKFKLLSQTEGKSINSCDVLKIVISVRGKGHCDYSPRCKKKKNL